MRSLADPFIRYFGFSTTRKIVVFESDDWGALRAPEEEDYEALKAKGVAIESDFNRLDTIASSYDMDRLANVLLSTKDNQGNHPSFTALCIMANPDFVRIAQNGFGSYYYKKFTKTQQEIYPNDNVLGAWQKAIEAGVFLPQLHGREHLNASLWLSQLQRGDYETHEAFKAHCWGIQIAPINGVAAKYLEAFNVIEPERELAFQESALREAAAIFKEIFSYSAKYFVAPNGPFSFKLLPVLAEVGIRQTVFPLFYKEPLGHGKQRRRICIPGRQVYKNVITIPRNAYFEPHLDLDDSVDKCLQKISYCFRNKLPCVISTHRLNYVSKFSQQNADNSLLQLKRLLNGILSAFPDIEFMNSLELGTLINSR